jgi:hypothetical protein
MVTSVTAASVVSTCLIMWSVVSIVGLGHMHFVSSPGDATFIPKVRVGVIGRVHVHPGRGAVLCLAPAQVPWRIGVVLMDPGLSEEVDRRELA